MSGFSSLDELARRPDATVLIVHARLDIDDGWHQAHVDAAAKAYPAMAVVGMSGYGGDADPFAGREVVFWPWMASATAQTQLRPFAAKVARTAKRVRMIAPPEGERLGPADLNGHEPIAWARSYAVDIAAALDQEVADLDVEWFGVAVEEPAPSPLEETHERINEPLVSDYIPAQDVQRFPFHSAADLVATPTPTDWLLQGWFERNTLAMYFGDPGSCKTWVALSQAVHIALGAPWHGAAVKQGAVFILCGEGHRGFRRRLEGIRQFHDIDFAFVPLYVSEGPANLTDAESVQDVIDSVEVLAQKADAAPALVVIDTLSRNFGAADENSTSDMAAFVNACDRLRTTYGCAVLAVHHSGHGDKTRGRGNSALRAALDAEYRFARDENGGIEASCTKAKDFEAPEPRRYRLANVALDWPPGDDGLPVNSAAVVPDAHVDYDTPAPSTAAPAYLGRNQAKTLETLERLYVEKARAMKDEGKDWTHAKVSLLEWRDATGLEKRRFEEARKALETRGSITSDGLYAFLASH